MVHRRGHVSCRPIKTHSHTLTLTKMTDFAGFEHCWKHLGTHIGCEYTTVQNMLKNLAVFRHYVAEWFLLLFQADVISDMEKKGQVQLFWLFVTKFSYCCLIVGYLTLDALFLHAGCLIMDVWHAHISENITQSFKTPQKAVWDEFRPGVKEL